MTPNGNGSFGVPRRWLRPTSFALAGIYFVTNCALAHSVETNFWAQRQRTPVADFPLPAHLWPPPTKIASPTPSSGLLSSRLRTSVPPEFRRSLVPVLTALSQNVGHVRKIL